jgi:c-di-GMP-binding flagellar brake protein YcgR
MQFIDLRIPVATRMHLTIVGLDYKPQQYSAQLLGFRRDMTVLAFLTKKPTVVPSALSTVAVRVGLQSAIVSFDSAVQQFFEQPFPYLHMAYPEKVTIEQQLRRSPRFPLDLPTTVAVQRDGTTSRPVRAHFTDISLNGARLTLEARLPEDATTVVLASSVFVAGTEQELQLLAEIRSLPEQNVPTAGAYPYGISFIETTSHQLLLLQALCYELQANSPYIHAG